MKAHNLFWGAILILGGGLLLLSNLGVLQVNVWGLIWPTFLIAIGAWILWSATVGRESLEVDQVEVSLDGANQAEIRFDYGAGKLRLGSRTREDLLLAGEFMGGLNYQTKRVGDALHVNMKSERVGPILLPFSMGPRDWTFDLNDQIPLKLDVDAGASDMRLDLTNLCVTELKLDTGASTVEVLLPAQAKHTYVDVSAGVATVRFQVPGGVAARIRVEGALSSTQIDRERFPRIGEVYQSPDYETAANKADIHIDAGVGSIEIR
ncbi:MAG: DUF5668 domain-containing protein [Chloroflexota bacterium]